MARRRCLSHPQKRHLLHLCQIPTLKFAARAQAASASDKPVVLRIDYEAGHGRGRAKAQIFKERADIFAFMMWQFGVEEYQLSD